MKLNVLINLFVLHGYLPECRCMHTHCFLANYSSVIIEANAVSRCELRTFGDGSVGRLFDEVVVEGSVA